MQNQDTKKTFPMVEQEEFRAMGTDIGLLIRVENEEYAIQARGDIAKARDMYAQYEKIFSRFDPASELSKANASIGSSISVSQDMIDVARKSLVYFQQYDGLFDPRILSTLESFGYARDFQEKDFSPQQGPKQVDVSRPLSEDLLPLDATITFHQRMDFSGIVKGYATDRVADFFRERGWKNFIVDSGGDMFVAGVSEDDSPWKIVIEGVDEHRLALALSDKAVATSGISRRKWEREGERFHHLIHPQHPDQLRFDTRSVTVLADSVEEADVLAKVLFIQNDTIRRAFVSQHQIPALFVYYNQTLWLSEAMKKYRTSSSA